MTPKEAYYCARIDLNCDIGKMQEIACKEPFWAYYFALLVPDADIGYCQRAVIKSQANGCDFCLQVPEANIEYIYSNMWTFRGDIEDFIRGKL